MTREETIGSLVAFISGHSFGSVQSLAETLYDRQIVPLLGEAWEEGMGAGLRWIASESLPANPYRVQP